MSGLQHAPLPKGSFFIAERQKGVLMSENEPMPNDELPPEEDQDEEGK